MIVLVDEANIFRAAMIHSVSWQDSHHSFCSPDFIKLHTPEHQQEYLKAKMNNGSKCYMLVQEKPIGIVSVTDSLIEDLYILPNEQNKGSGLNCCNLLSGNVRIPRHFGYLRIM